jgi:hypothetical protein
MDERAKSMSEVAPQAENISVAAQCATGLCRIKRRRRRAAAQRTKRRAVLGAMGIHPGKRGARKV